MFKGFILLNSMKIVFNLGKMFEGGGLGRAKNIGALFFSTFDHFTLFKSAGRKNSVQNPNTFSEADNIKFHAVLSHFEKCRDLRVKVLRGCPE